MHKKWLNLQSDGADGGADDSGGADEESKVGGGDDEGGEPAGDDAPAAATATGLSKEDITEILSKAMPVQQAEPPKPVEKQYTQDEIDTLLNVWKPTGDLLTRLRSDDTAVAGKALLEMRDGLIKQSNTMAETRLQQLLSDMRTTELAPLQEFYTQHQAQQIAERFYSKHEDLKPYELIVDAVTSKLETSGFKARSQEAVFDEIAKNSREVIKQLKIPVAAGKRSANGQRMAQLSGGGQMGGGTIGAKRKAGMEIFDEATE